MTELVLFIGVQATGKSTYFRQKFFESHVRVNLDMLRTRHREWTLFEACLATGQKLVVDNTNPTAKERSRYIGPAKDAGFRIRGFYFATDLEACKARNLGRSEDQIVPLRGILGTLKRMERPNRSEGFDELFFVSIADGNEFWRWIGVMKFDDLDRKMRVFETAHDFRVLPGMWIVARIDGRNFTSLTKERHPFDAPFDERFRDMMLETTEHLMTSGFQVEYGYTQSDEISLLFRLEESTFGRKLRKFISVLAGEASAKFSLLLGDLAAFDCRISQLPDRKLVVDYFRWRNEDAHRNALNAHCYWCLRKEEMSADQATQSLLSLSISAKNELLFQRGLNFNDLPNWQKRGIGLYWERYAKEATNPKTREKIRVERRQIRRELELPRGEEYSQFLMQLASD